MPRPSDVVFERLRDQFRQALEECRQLYRDSARAYVRQHPNLVRGAADDFVGRMVDLHRGLVLKVFVEMAHADGRVSTDDLLLGRDLFLHCWGKHLDEAQVKEAMLRSLQSQKLGWDDLLSPFGRLPTFRPQAWRVLTLTQRLARLVAETEEPLDDRSLRQMQAIGTEMDAVLHPIPVLVDEEPEPPPSPSKRPVAVRVETSPLPVDFEIFGLKPTPRPAAPLPGAGPGGALAEALTELDGLIGLATIKREVRELVDYLQIQAQRRAHALPTTAVSLHAVYTGNPGTGKTSVARVVGRTLGALGILAKGHLIETDRSGLVAEYAGQTAPKTNQRIDAALDGVLFIDEAYSLVAERGDDPYGAEAVQTLLKRMEDDRDRLVVILAGYPEEMRRLLESNPGLSSRFGRQMDFPDYAPVELGHIFERFCARDNYQLPAATRARLLGGFQYLHRHRTEHFGNGRLARNVFERSLRRQASRLAGLAALTRELLTTLESDDLVFEDVPAEAWAGLNVETAVVRLKCPGCGHGCKLPARSLGAQVRCGRCPKEFPAAWGEIAPGGEGKASAD